MKIKFIILIMLFFGIVLYSQETLGIKSNNQVAIIKSESLVKQSELFPTEQEKIVFKTACDSYINTLKMCDRVNQLVIERNDIYRYPILSISKISTDIWLIQHMELKYVDNNGFYNYLLIKEFLWKWVDEETIQYIKKDVLDDYIINSNPIINLEK